MTTEIINKNGKSYAVIPYDFYQQLIEDAEMLADIKTYNIGKNKSEESFPSEVVDSIFLKGENPMKVYREYRGLSIVKLCHKDKCLKASLQTVNGDIVINFNNHAYFLKNL